MKGILIYTMDGCPYCSNAKSFLRERGLEFQELEVSPGTAQWEEMQEKTGSDLVPQILINGEAIGGYADLRDLDSAGTLQEKLGLEVKKDLPFVYDVIIIGGGPAGLNAALYSSRKILSTLLISKNLGGQVADTYDLENYLGFSQVETIDLIRKFDEHVEKYGVEKRIGEAVTSVELTGKVKKITISSGETFCARTVIVASGKRPRQLNAEGEKKLVGRGVAYCSTCDAPLFAGADVAVIGGGNSALEAVIDLDKVANNITLISLTPLAGDPILQKQVNNSAKTKVLTGFETTRILGDQSVTGLEIRSLSTGEEVSLDVEGVFIEIGLLPNSDIFLDTLATNQTGEIEINSKCSTGVAGVFACGDVTDVPYKQAIIAAGEGAKAALSAYEYLITRR